MVAGRLGHPASTATPRLGMALEARAYTAYFEPLLPVQPSLSLYNRVIHILRLVLPITARVIHRSEGWSGIDVCGLRP
jgi:hypothetical protein